MPILTLTTHGTRQRFVTPGATTLPSAVACNRLQIDWVNGTNVYIGVQRPLGVANTVSSTVYDKLITSTLNTITLGPFDDVNAIYLTDMWWDSDTDGAKISITPMTI